MTPNSPTHRCLGDCAQWALNRHNLGSDLSWPSNRPVPQECFLGSISPKMVQGRCGSSWRSRNLKEVADAHLQLGNRLGSCCQIRRIPPASHFPDLRWVPHWLPCSLLHWTRSSGVDVQLCSFPFSPVVRGPQAVDCSRSRSSSTIGVSSA